LAERAIPGESAKHSASFVAQPHWPTQAPELLTLSVL
jgi:hypothetical protein